MAHPNRQGRVGKGDGAALSSRRGAVYAHYECPSVRESHESTAHAVPDREYIIRDVLGPRSRRIFDEPAVRRYGGTPTIAREACEALSTGP